MDYQIINIPKRAVEGSPTVMPYDEMTAIEVQAIYTKLMPYATLSDEQASYLKAIENRSITCISGDVDYFSERLNSAKDWSTVHKIFSLYVSASLIAGLPLAILGIVEATQSGGNETALGLWLGVGAIALMSFCMVGPIGGFLFKILEDYDKSIENNSDLGWKDFFIAFRAPLIAFKREANLQAKQAEVSDESRARMESAIKFYSSADHLLRQSIKYYAADILRTRYEETYKYLCIQKNSRDTQEAATSLDFAILETIDREEQLKTILGHYDTTILLVQENLEHAKVNAILQR